MKNKLTDRTSVVIIAIVVLLMLVAVFMIANDIGDREADSELVEEMIGERRDENQNIIDSLIVEQGKMLREIKSLQKQKSALAQDYEKIKKQLAKYSGVRLYRDADFYTESRRIATSRYRHDPPDGDPSQGKGDNRR